MDSTVARRRDRRGRGIRGPLVPVTTPLSVTRAARFAGLVMAAVERLEPRWGPLLAALDVDVLEVPPNGVEVSVREVPLAEHRRGGHGRAPVIVVYRHPVELRAPDLLTRVELLRDLVTEQLAEILGMDPGELDPRYDGRG